MKTKDIEHYLKLLGAKTVMVLATSWQDQVSARSMSVVLLEGCIYFQTDTTMNKASQMQANPRVALCADNFQVTGLARKIGTWRKHPAILKAYQHKHEGSYRKFGDLENEAVYEVRIETIKVWEYQAGEPWQVEINLGAGTVERRPYG